MKQLTIEEKAKRYDEALEMARDYYKANLKLNKADENLILEDIFPELAELKDERIIKNCIHFLELQKTHHASSVEIDECIDWLEKQVEKPTLPKWKYKKDNTPLLRDSIILSKYGSVTKSPSGAIISDAWVLDYAELAKLPKEEIEKQDVMNSIIKHNEVESRFKVGDWICNGGGNPCKVNYIFGNYYELCSAEGYEYNKPISDVDTNYHLWTINDAKSGDVLASKDGNNILIFRNLDTATSFSSYYNLRGKGELGWSNKSFIPATKEQRDTLMKAMSNAGWKFDFDKKELREIHVIDEGKSEIDYCFTKMMNGEKVSSAWSEEDEQKFRDVIRLIEQGAPVQSMRDHYINWLKFIKDRLNNIKENKL